jgi:hypothetical protein
MTRHFVLVRERCVQEAKAMRPTGPPGPQIGYDALTRIAES